MPQITAVKETKRGRLALFVDGEFAFSLDPETFADADLHEEDEIESFRLEELRRQSDTRKAVDRALDILALRDHAAGELYQKLCRKFDPHSAAAAVAKAEELGLLNDADFARRRAAELMRKRKSRREVEQDLAAKGIDRDTAAQVLEKLYAPEDGPDPEVAAACALVQRQYARKLAEGKRPQVMAALARRGFSYAVIRTALEANDAGEDDFSDLP
ncbi:MAG TPA: RecX family transcriptional regulator [Candidatus Gemmiger faecavium]|nr:RecX family transcriptional regulator [Candidatus Gemmiger faecavium]